MIGCLTLLVDYNLRPAINFQTKFPEQGVYLLSASLVGGRIIPRVIYLPRDQFVCRKGGELSLQPSGDVGFHRYHVVEPLDMDGLKALRDMMGCVNANVS